jgi:teichuronic acid biosynthesis glycosyltransferase TuaC
MTDRSIVAESQTPPRPLHLLTLTPFYPILGDDAQGCFVAEPLSALARLGVTNTVRVAAPFYRSPFSLLPFSRKSEAVGDSAVLARSVRFFSFPGGYGLPSSGAFLFARLLPEVRRLHESHQVDVIHAHSALACGHAAALLSKELKIPFVVTVHGLDAFSTRQVGGIAGEWCARVSRSVYRSARSVICVSEKIRDQVISGVAGPVNTAVVYNGVDPQVFSPADEEPLPPMVLCVGNLIPTKGHEPLLRAFAAVQSEFQVLSLEVVGDGPERFRLEKLAGGLGVAGKVHFRGRQSRRQVADTMRRATIFALPSRYEGLGCVYLEAMAAGKPVIACRGQGIDEVIENGVNGFLIEPENVKELSTTLTELLRQTDLRRRVGEAARLAILRGYTLAEQAARLSLLYRERQA